MAPPPAGDNLNPGTITQPWGSIEHAAASVPDDRCTVWFEDGIYTGDNRIKRRFETYTRFVAVNPYKAILQNAGPVVSISGGSFIILEGFVFQHSVPDATPLVVQVDGSDKDWSEHIIFYNNIFRDSYNNDLLKIYNGARFVLVDNNLFYNQGPAEQHIDVNSVTDVTIQDNVFFNDFRANDRPIENDTKHYIVIKDSNEGEDALLGSERIIVQRNVFLNWQGNEGETFVQVGNDGKPYFEAKEIFVQNNLFLGNSLYPMRAAFGVSGARDVYFVNNTISGNLPSNAYAARIDIKDANPPNTNIVLCNNIWSDPTGTMGAVGSQDDNEFAEGEPANTVGLILDHNLYWNGAQKIPAGDLLSPLTDDVNRILADPQLDTRFANLTLPVWSGSEFPSGNLLIREEFLDLAQAYGALPQDSPAIGKGDPDCASENDIFQYLRGTSPSLGADQGVAWSTAGLFSLDWSAYDYQPNIIPSP